MIKIKRVYEDYEDSDGYRILVDRLWPRGVSKMDTKVDEWLKEIAPSNELRKWFSHQVSKWPEFKEKYFKELKNTDELISSIIDKETDQIVTLVYAAKDEEHNNAVALKEYLEDLKSSKKKK